VYRKGKKGSQSREAKCSGRRRVLERIFAISLFIASISSSLAETASDSGLNSIKGGDTGLTATFSSGDNEYSFIGHAAENWEFETINNSNSTVWDASMTKAAVSGEADEYYGAEAFTACISGTILPKGPGEEPPPTDYSITTSFTGTLGVDTLEFLLAVGVDTKQIKAQMDGKGGVKCVWNLTKTSGGSSFAEKEGFSEVTVGPGCTWDVTDVAQYSLKAKFDQQEVESNFEVVKVDEFTAETIMDEVSAGETIYISPGALVTFIAKSSVGEEGTNWPENWPKWKLDGDAVSNDGSSTYSENFSEGNHEITVSCGSSEKSIDVVVAEDVRLKYRLWGESYWYTASSEASEYIVVAKYAAYQFKASLLDSSGNSITVPGAEFSWSGEAAGKTGSTVSVIFENATSPSGFPTYVGVSSCSFSDRQYMHVVNLANAHINTQKVSDPPDANNRELTADEVQYVGETYSFIYDHNVFGSSYINKMTHFRYEIWNANEIDTYGASPVASGLIGYAFSHTWTSPGTYIVRFYYDNFWNNLSVTWAENGESITSQDPHLDSPAFTVVEQE
jgi:hypothetical protein